MAFQIKDFVSVAASLINYMRGTQGRVTDFNVGGVARTMLEAPAIEIEQVYQQLRNGLQEAIPVATYNSFSFARLGAVAASGVVRVTIAVQTTNTVIPAGAAFSLNGSGAVVEAVSGATITAGNTYADIAMHASAAGAAGNIAAGQAFTPSSTIAGFVSAANAAAFVGGRDVESDDQRKQRFQSYVSTLSRGTPAAISYGASTAAIYATDGVTVVEKVAAALVVEPYETDNTQPPGLVNLYVHNGVGGTSAALVGRADAVVRGYTDPTTGVKVAGYKAAGAHLVTAAATETALNVTGVVTVQPGYVAATVLSAVSGALAAYILSLGIGEAFQVAEAIFRVKSIAGVGNFVLSAPSPTADASPAATAKYMPGSLTITAA